MPIAKDFALPLRAAMTADGVLVLSDAEDRDVLVASPSISEGFGAARRRLQELADAFNAAHAAPPEIAPGEERAIRAFTRKGYARRLGDQAGLAAIRGFSESRPNMPSHQIAKAAVGVAEAFLEERGYTDETD